MVKTVKNIVTVNMNGNVYWYATIQKGKFVVVLLCDLKSNVCYTFGGKKLNICKNIKRAENQEDLYDIFMRKIGKMCKKDIDENGHYFSNLDGFVSEDSKKKYIDNKVLLKLNQIAGSLYLYL